VKLCILIKFIVRKIIKIKIIRLLGV